MTKEDFNQVLSSFEAVQCILSSILCPSILCSHCNASPLLCPINATYSSSYVFRLQYPRVLHCRIVPLLYTIYNSVLMSVFQKVGNTRILRYTAKNNFADRLRQTWRSKNSRVGRVVSAIFAGFTL